MTLIFLVLLLVSAIACFHTATSNNGGGALYAIRFQPYLILIMFVLPFGLLAFTPDVNVSGISVAIWSALVVIMLGISSFLIATSSKNVVVAINPYQGSPQKNKKLFCYILMASSLLVQTYIYWSYGGVAGYILAYTNRFVDQGGREPGLVTAIAESFNICLICLLVNRMAGLRWSYLRFAGYGALIFLSLIYFGGLKGSRSHYIYDIFVYVFLVHYCVRKLGIKFYFCAGILAIMFLTVYSGYKGYGDEFINNFNINQLLENKKYGGGNSLAGVMDTDIGKAAVQLRVFDASLNSRVAGGQTYLYSLLHLFPGGDGAAEYLEVKKKAYWGARILYQAHDDYTASSIVYTYWGEWALNFGLTFILLSPVLYGLMLVWISRMQLRFNGGDVFVFCAVPTLTLSTCVLFAADLDNFLFFLQRAFLPIAFINIPALAGRVMKKSAV